MHYLRNKIKLLTKSVTILLLLVVGVHVFGIHGLMQSLVYCFEQDGKVNVESKSNLFFGFVDEVSAHEVKEDHSHTDLVFHEAHDKHRDVPISEVHVENDKINRYDQQENVKSIHNNIYSNIDVLPESASFQRISFISPLIESQSITHLQTVVMLN